MRFSSEGAEKCDDLGVAPSLQQRGLLIAYAAKKLDRVKLNLPCHDSLPPAEHWKIAPVSEILDQRVGPDFELRVVASSDHRSINVNAEFLHQVSLALRGGATLACERLRPQGGR